MMKPVPIAVVVQSNAKEVGLDQVPDEPIGPKCRPFFATVDLFPVNSLAQGGAEAVEYRSLKQIGRHFGLLPGKAGSRTSCYEL